MQSKLFFKLSPPIFDEPPSPKPSLPHWQPSINHFLIYLSFFPTTHTNADNLVISLSNFSSALPLLSCGMSPSMRVLSSTIALLSFRALIVSLLCEFVLFQLSCPPIGKLFLIHVPKVELDVKLTKWACNKLSSNCSQAKKNFEEPGSSSNSKLS